MHSDLHLGPFHYFFNVWYNDTLQSTALLRISYSLTCIRIRPCRHAFWDDSIIFQLTYITFKNCQYLYMDHRRKGFQHSEYGCYSLHKKSINCCCVWNIAENLRKKSIFPYTAFPKMKIRYKEIKKMLRFVIPSLRIANFAVSSSSKAKKLYQLVVTVSQRRVQNNCDILLFVEMYM